MWAILIGYARISTAEQDGSLLDALDGSGCVRVFSDTASGALDVRPEFARALDHLLVGERSSSRGCSAESHDGVAFQSQLVSLFSLAYPSFLLQMTVASHKSGSDAQSRHGDSVYITSVIEHSA